jgi:hypothetical protein
MNAARSKQAPLAPGGGGVVGSRTTTAVEVALGLGVSDGAAVAVGVETAVGGIDVVVGVGVEVGGLAGVGCGAVVGGGMGVDVQANKIKAEPSRATAVDHNLGCIPECFIISHPLQSCSNHPDPSSAAKNNYSAPD